MGEGNLSVEVVGHHAEAHISPRDGKHDTIKYRWAWEGRAKQTSIHEETMQHGAPSKQVRLRITFDCTAKQAIGVIALEAVWRRPPEQD